MNCPHCQEQLVVKGELAFARRIARIRECPRCEERYLTREDFVRPLGSPGPTVSGVQDSAVVG